MTDSVQIWKPGFRILDDNGDPVAGGKLKFFDAGTSTPRTVYTDKDLSANASTVITADSSGVPQVSSTDVVAYTNTSDYKVTITDADDNVLVTIDNLAGALDTSSYLTVSAAWNTDTISKTSSFTVDASAEYGKVLLCDCTSASITVTLPAVADMTDGDVVIVKRLDDPDVTSNTLTIVDDSTELIDGAASIALTKAYECVSLVTDGSTWHVQFHYSVGGANKDVEVDATYRSITATAVVDDSIPQTGETTAIDAITITPKTASSKIKIEFHVPVYPSADMNIVVGIWEGADAGASWAQVWTLNTGDYSVLSGVAILDPASSSSVTYTLRAGTTTGTLYLLGDNSNRMLGGVQTSSLIATEF